LGKQRGARMLCRSGQFCSHPNSGLYEKSSFPPSFTADNTTDPSSHPGEAQVLRDGFSVSQS